MSKKSNDEGYEMYRKGYLQGYERCKREVRHRLNLFNPDILDLEIFLAPHGDYKEGGAE